MNLKQREARKAKQEANKIKVGDSVIIANRFFLNHGLKYQDLGIGIVNEIKEITAEHQQPSLIIRLPKTLSAAVIFDMFVKDLLIISKNYQFENFITIKIHPLYVEKVTVKKVRKVGRKI